MRPIIALAVLSLASVSFAQTADVLVTVNGKAVKKEDVANRLWAVHANEALNQIVDETLMEQAVAAYEAKAAKKDKEAWKKEVDARLKNLKSQFKDEAAFNENLSKAQVTVENLRRQIEAQLARENLLISAKNISVSPAEAKEFFEANKEKLGGQESAHLRHILVGGEQQAKDLQVALRVGADFAKVAQELSLDAGSKERGGDLGFVTRGMLAPDLEKVVLSLKPGEISEVVKTQLGFHLFKVEEKRAAKAVVFKDVEKDLTRAILTQKISQALPVYLKELRAQAKMVTSPGVSVVPAGGAQQN